MKANIILAALLALVALTTFGQDNNIADTYWRNEQTGDWLIGFAEKHVIYNNKVWEIASQTEKKDAYTLIVDNGETIKVGKAKNGRRTIAIGKDKPIVCSQVTTEYLPEYPTKDLTPFKDNGYRTGDTATIVGWLKDCPAEVLGKNREFGDFLYYYHVNAEYGDALLQQQHMTPEAFLRMDKEGQLPLSQEERAFVERWAQMVVDYRGVNPSAYAELDKKYEGMKNRILSFLSEDHVMEAIITHIADPLEIVAEMVDSTYTDPLLRDIVKTRRLCQQIDENRMPLTDTQLAIVDQIQTPVARHYVLAHNDKYLALQRRDISREQSLKSNDGLDGMSDGEQILRKITELYRGRLILLDVWGTWCGPCKDALSHSKEEFERLKDYNLVYLYLANRSEDEAWKNVVKEYDLTGDDIVHYNLPAAQQSAIEHFLNVHAFPTYKLIDRDGTVLDVNADPRNLESLTRLLEKLK